MNLTTLVKCPICSLGMKPTNPHKHKNIQNCDFCDNPTKYNNLVFCNCCFGDDYSICIRCKELHEYFNHAYYTLNEEIKE